MSDAVIRIGGNTLNVSVRGGQGPRGFNGPDLIDLAAPDGAEQIGSPDGTVQDSLDGIQTAAASEIDAQRRVTGLRGAATGDATVVLCGDSFFRPAAYQSGVGYMVPRSILNAAGGGYHGVLNLGDFGGTYAGSGFTSATFAQHGIWGNGEYDTGGRALIASGGNLYSTGIEADSMVVGYDASNSTVGAVIHLRIGGVDAATHTVAGTGLQSVTMSFGRALKATEGWDLYVTGGSLELTMAAPRITTTSPVPRIYVGARSGYALQDYSSTAALDELAFWLNRDGSAKRTIIFEVVTNNLYREADAYPYRPRTPAEVATLMETIRAGLATRVTTGLRVAFTVPARSSFPIQLSGYTHQDYVDAIVAYAAAHPDVTLVRQDRTLFYDGNNSSDGLHPDLAGHQIYSAPLVDALGIPFDPAPPATSTSDTAVGVFTYTSPWAAFGGGNGVNVIRKGNRVAMSGTASSNSAMAYVIGTLPSGFRPNVYNRIVPVANAANTVFVVQVATTGVVTLLGSTIPSNIDLGGVVFDIEGL